VSGDAAPPDTQAAGLQLPEGFAVHSTPAELRVKARLGYETVEPTMMSYLMVWVLLIMAVLMGFTGFDRDVPKWFGTFFFGSLVVFGLAALAANFLNRAHLRVNGHGVTAGIWPVPVNGFSYHRYVRTSAIAGIYVAQCDLWVRLRRGLFRTYEVHALTSSGEAVCLLQRIPEMSAATNLAVEIRKRLAPLPQIPPPLRGGKRYTSERSFEFAGFLPWWFFWLGMLLIGLEGVAFPILRLAGWERVPATVSRTGTLYHARRGCTVKFATAGGPVSTRVENGCSTGVSAGDVVAVYYNPTNPAAARILTMPLWPVALMFGGLGVSALIFGREREQFADGKRILWQEKFTYLSRYWHLKEKTNAEAAKGVLTLFGFRGAEVLPYTQLAVEPASVEVKVGTGQRIGPDEEAGVLYAAGVDGIGYVFGIVPSTQMAFARRVGRDWTVDLMPATYVREIVPQPGGWNTLKVAIAGNRAEFLVNGARAGSVDYQPTMGGGMVGLYADFGAGQTVWQFTGLVVHG
jgi:hypothetical protein